MDSDLLATMGIGGFGKLKKKPPPGPPPQQQARHDAARRPPTQTLHPAVAVAVPPPGESPLNNPSTLAPRSAPAPEIRDDDVHDEDDDEDDDDASPEFPTTHEAKLKDHTKVISALSLDPSGARFATGSHDYDVKLWDFGGMGGGVGKPFKSFEPAESYYVNQLRYNWYGTQFLCISATMQPKLYDRDGEEIANYIKGDPYIRDMKNTAGHVGEVTGCYWDPSHENRFITSSADSTIRIWDVENKRKQDTVIVVKSKERGARTKVTTCCYSTSGSQIVGVCYDGAMHMWSCSSNFVRPNTTCENAHGKGTETGSVQFDLSGNYIATRGGDGTVKTWDVRQLKKNLYTASDLPAPYPNMNAIWSPDQKYIVTAVAGPVKDGKNTGRLVFLKREGLTIAHEVAFDSCVVNVQWHSKINQIFTAHADGSVRILYSPLTSTHGALLLNRQRDRRKITVEDVSASLQAGPVITPGDEPVQGMGPSSKRKREKERMDPRKSMRPELPVSGPGRGGRVGASATQHVVQNLVRDTMRDEDPREALLRMAEKVDNDLQWTKAWKESQPKPVFRDLTPEEDEE